MSNTLNISAKTIDTTDNDTRSYQPLAVRELSDAFVSRLTKWWDKLGKSHEIELDLDNIEDGYVCSVDDLPGGVDFITTYCEPDYGYASGGISMTLGDLANTLSNEHAMQFVVAPSKVESIGKDSKTGFFKLGVMLMPIEVTYLYDESDDMQDDDSLVNTLALSGHIGGGRHRLTFDLTVFQCVDGWEELNVTVIPRGFESIELQSLYILASNGARTMTPTEKTVVQTSAENINIDDIDALFDAAEKNSTMWGKAAQLVSVNLWDEYMGDTELADAKLNTKGKFGSSILTAAKKAIKTFGLNEKEVEAKKLNEETKGLVSLLRRRSVFEPFMEGALDTFAANFDALKPMAQSESGGHNYARFMSRIATSIANVLVDDDLIEQLQAIAEQDAKAKREKAKARERAKAAKAEDKKLKLAKEVQAIGGPEALMSLLAEAQSKQAETQELDDDDDDEEVETVMVEDEEDEDDDDFTPPPAAKGRRVNRKRR